MAPFTFDAFLNYASEDKELARRFSEWLRRTGFEVWIDEEQQIPGSPWRDGLKEGLLASRHLVALLTGSYSSRRWTQREVDLFDLAADQTERRMLGIQFGEIELGTLDQVFLVNQRLFWKGEGFDPETFWKLYCGLKGEKPGPQSEWANKGNALLSKSSEALEKAEVRDTMQTPQRIEPLRYESITDQLINERTRTKETLEHAAINAVWECVGPTNIGGRTTSLVCHPTKPQVVWLGSAGGGVWMSNDGGESWQALWHTQDSLGVGSLAIDPANPATIYCGTGVANSRDFFPGVGLYKSSDSGRTWKLQAATAKGIPRQIGVIAIDPFDSDHLLLGGVNYGELGPEEGDVAGLYVSLDAGNVWTSETFISAKGHSCHSIIFHPTRKGTIFASFSQAGSDSGIWRSTDGGKNWTHLLRELDPLRFGRTSLTISPSRPEVLYAFAADAASENSELLLGVFRSANGGNTWKEISGQHFINERQIFYANSIVVHPTDHDYVICGGVDLHRTRDGGRTWSQVTHWDADRGDPQYAHANHQALIMPLSAPGLIYDANDGGVDISLDGGQHWKNRSNGLAITEFYQLDVAPSDSRCYGGGTEQNGVVLTIVGLPDKHFELLSGDAGRLLFDPKDPAHVFASYYNLNIYRFRGERAKNVSPPAKKLEKSRVWNAAIAIDPLNSTTVFAGSQRVWRTRDDGASWVPVSHEFDGSSISSLEVSRADRKRVYAGTEKGGIFRSANGGNAWSHDIVGPIFPRSTITSIKSSSVDADAVFASVAGYGHSHIFYSEDAGERWFDIDQGMLPDVPHQSIATCDDDPKSVYVCCEVGVYFSPDLGSSWQDLTGQLPNTLFVDLVYHQKDGALYVATRGRSIWRMQIR